MTLPENVSALSTLIPRPEKDTACQSLIEMPDVTKHGFLRKMAVSWSGRLLDSFLNRKWSSKFVVLRAGCVYIYANETASSCDRAYSLFGFQDVHLCPGDAYKGGKWVFQVVDALRDDEHDRSLLFSANSEDDMKVWVECFHKEIIKGNKPIMAINSSTSPSSPTSATLPKIGSKPNNEPQTKVNVMPRLSDKDKEKMKLSMKSVDDTVNIGRNNNESSSDESYTDIQDDDIETAKARPKSRPLPEIPSERLKALPPKPDKPNDFHGDARPQPLPKPKPKPPGGTLPKPEPPQKKPTNPVKPMITPGVSHEKPTPTANKNTKVLVMPSVSTAATLKLMDRQVPAPPAFEKVVKKNSPMTFKSQTSIDDTTTGYEFQGGSCMGIEYEVWEMDDKHVTDPLVKAAFWHQDSAEALKVMMSITDDGAFLIRDASDGLDYKTLMVRMSEVDSHVRKYKIIKEPSNTYSLHLGQSGFKTLQELIKYYQQNSLPNRNVKLTKPYTEVWRKT